MAENTYIYEFGETLFLIIYSISERRKESLILDSHKTNFKKR